MRPLKDSHEPIVVKIQYIKLIFLVDRKKHEDNPVFKSQLRRSGKEFPVYDASIFYQFTQFAPDRPLDHQWRFTSSQGYVDALQLHPFDPTSSSADPAKKTITNFVEGYLRPTPDSLLVVCQNYNGFQREGGEWAGVRSANDTALLRLVVDFSSLMTVPGKALFAENPHALWVHELEKDPSDSSKKLETPLEFEYSDGRIFAVSQKHVPKRDVILIRYKMNWDSLITWQGYYKNEKLIPRMIV